MNAYDYLLPYTQEQWVKNENWVINRIVFLVTLESRNNEKFHGGDIDLEEEITDERLAIKFKHSFNNELELLKIKCPKQYVKAVGMWVNSWYENQILYLEVKE